MVTQTKPVLQTRQASVKIPGLDRGRDGVSEDGEVIEDGELEDVYEPAVSQQQATAVGQMQQQLSTAASRTPDDPSQQPTSERDGSYSPHLSPRELVQFDKVLPNPPNGSRISPFHLEDKHAHNQSRHQYHRVPPQQTSTVLQEEDCPSRSRLEDAKKQAMDTILQLWPLDVRFDNFLAEGIDKTVLKSLFQDLGLTIDEPSQTHKAASSTTSVAKAEKSEPTRRKAEVKRSEKSSPAVKDKSEERKDRIARLLAAKGSKQSIPTAAAAPQLQNPQSPAADLAQAQAQAQAQAPATTKSTKPSMSQVEKSKLIQQKLAALQKAREIPQRPKAIQPEISDSGRNDSSIETVDAVNAASHSESIPGLSLSPLKRSSKSSEATAEAARTQAATSQNAELSTPFDQYPDSRPFLIHISDEEDEGEEMELDSPIRAQTLPSMPGTPARHDAWLDDSLAVSEPSLNRRLQSPASMSIPLRSASRNNGGDLESMNKKIEEMKRKIAEAEARKVAKNSPQGSPALSQRNDSSRENDSDVMHGPRAPLKPFYGDSHSGPNRSLSPTQRRRSRSRVASERLPLLEARRREQLEKLKDLQSEVARIEMELEKDKLEQERLKEEIMSSDSDRDDSPPPVMEIAPTTEARQASLVSDKMDVAEECFVEAAGEGQRMAPILDEQQSQSPGEVSAVDAPLSDDIAAIGNDESSSAAAKTSVGGLTASSSDNENAASDGSTWSKIDTSQSDGVGASATQVNDEDIVMENTGYSADEDAKENSEDDYEPPGVIESSVAADDEASRLPGRPASPAEDNGHEAVEQAKAGIKAPPAAASDANPGRNSVAGEAALPSAPRTSFVPYETPLQYFHAYRYHPSFNQSVAGGLRSLTYSNKIDVKKELCPDELAGQPCPRGSNCDYQHFGTMQAPDDQILLQLGEAERYNERQEDDYFIGLKQLLTDYRTRKVKDFDIISQGIIDYRARFLGDKTRVLPLGHIAP
ncbi:hypothetical protein E4U41_004431 [Claviceps citrina]|nr:hypothetical protein E4U41_004431 [Claviceps citrina]